MATYVHIIRCNTRLVKEQETTVTYLLRKYCCLHDTDTYLDSKPAENHACRIMGGCLFGKIEGHYRHAHALAQGLLYPDCTFLRLMRSALLSS